MNIAAKFLPRISDFPLGTGRISFAACAPHRDEMFIRSLGYARVA